MFYSHKTYWFILSKWATDKTFIFVYFPNQWANRCWKRFVGCTSWFFSLSVNKGRMEELSLHSLQSHSKTLNFSWQKLKVFFPEAVHISNITLSQLVFRWKCWQWTFTWSFPSVQTVPFSWDWAPSMDGKLFFFWGNLCRETEVQLLAIRGEQCVFLQQKENVQQDVLQELRNESDKFRQHCKTPGKFKNWHQPPHHAVSWTSFLKQDYV